MSKAQVFHAVTSGIASIASVLALGGAAYWGIFVFPDMAEAKRGWPAHPSVEGCVAVRGTPQRLGRGINYVEAGVTIANNTGKDVILDSVRFEVSVERVPSVIGRYDVEDVQIVVSRDLPELRLTVPSRGAQMLSGKTVRSRETKHYWRGVVLPDTSKAALYEFIVRVFVRGDSEPFGFARPLWLSDPLGRCPWNAPPV